MSGQNIDAVLARANQEAAGLRSKLAAAADQKEGYYKDAVRQLDELDATIGQEFRQAQRAWWDADKDKDFDEWERLRNHKNELDKKYQETQRRLYDESNGIERKYKQDIAAAIRGDNKPAVTELDYTGTKFSKETRAAHNEGVEFLSNIFDGEQYPDGFKVGMVKMRRGGRAHYNPLEKSVNVTDADESWVLVHEIGHAIEDQYPDVHQRAVEFLLKRRNGEQPQTMKQLTGSKFYKKDEIAYKDNFTEPYMGKVYTGGLDIDDPKNYQATEIISMGVQKYYQDAGAFQAADPEYFDFIYAILRRLT